MGLVTRVVPDGALEAAALELAQRGRALPARRAGRDQGHHRRPPRGPGRRRAPRLRRAPGRPRRAGAHRGLPESPPGPLERPRGRKDTHGHHASAPLHPRDGQPRLPVVVLDRARQDQGGRVRADRRARDLRRRDPARDPRPGARGHRRALRRRDAPLLLRADLLRPHGGPGDARAAAQDRPLRLRQRAALPGHPEGHGAEGARHRGRVQVPGDPDRPAGEGHLPGTGDALDPHPDPARRRLRRRPPRALLGPGARGQRGAQGPRRRRGRPGSRSTSPPRPSCPARPPST